MENSFSQRDRLFNRKCFMLYEDGLQFEDKSLLKSDETFVKYEDIGTKIIINKTGKKGWLIATGGLFILSIILLIDRYFGGDVGSSAELFYFLLGLGCLLVYIFTYKQSFHLTKFDNTNSIEFLLNNPSKLEFDKFIEKLKTRRRDCLLEKYGQLNKNLSYENQYENLIWLRNNDVLISEEFKFKLKELDDLFKQNRIIGFGTSNN